jgi:protein arginine N-methyltransferase 5
MMSLVNLLSGEGPGASGRCGEKVQQCWQFEHPRRDLIVDSAGECGNCDCDCYAPAHPRTR